MSEQETSDDPQELEITINEENNAFAYTRMATYMWAVWLAIVVILLLVAGQLVSVYVF